ncbi:GGDEF domain-containing protein [Celeribacter sp.]|uniref:GGDEF domain-containing protein n=1 Tax=Celeribacter sp. TaxID=1890673 RepID=UPI003A916D58
MPKRTLRLIHRIKRAQPKLAIAGMGFAVVGAAFNIAGIKAGLMVFRPDSFTHPITFACLIAIGMKLLFLQRRNGPPAWVLWYAWASLITCMLIIFIRLSGVATRDLDFASFGAGTEIGMVGLDTAIICFLLLVALLLRFKFMRLMFVASAMSIELLALTTFAKLYDLPMFGLDMSLFTFLSLLCLQLSVVAAASNKQPFAVMLLPTPTGRTTRSILAGMLIISATCGVGVTVVMRTFRAEFSQLAGVAIIIALTTTVVLSAMQVILLAQTTHKEAVQRRIAKRRLERMAKTDMLTGVLNRHAGWDALHRHFGTFKTQKRPTTIAMIDIDHFKGVNDTHGHDIGDLVLKRFATTLRKSVGDAGLVCRWGGEEFIVILPDTPMETAKAKIEKIRQSLSHAEGIAIDNTTVLIVTASTGVSEFDTGDSAPGAALNRADSALYAAKSAGRDMLCWMDATGAAYSSRNAA